MKERRDFVAGFAPEALLVDDHDNAIMGVGFRCGQPPLVVYDSEMIRLNLRLTHGMDEQDSIEFFNFNIVGAWHGEQTPVFTELCDTSSLLQQIRILKDKNTKLLLKIAEYEAREY